MSAEYKMSAEADLPKKLREIESRLGQLSPLPSEVNRDMLMYQTGWAAAEAQFARPRAWLWPATSAALAACLLLMLSAANLRPSPTPLVDSDTPRADDPLMVSLPRVPRITVPTAKQYPPTATLLVMRDRALRSEFDSLSLSTADFAGGVVDEARNGPATSRELLRELLPARPSATRTQIDWQPWWSRFRSGESS
ncbi:MAG: hypothetical protein AAGD11_05875 [Planctomycetota bacterium]